MLAKDVKEKYDKVKFGLEKCTEAQQKLFARMYPNDLRVDQLDRAIDQIERTLKKNKDKEI